MVKPTSANNSSTIRSNPYWNGLLATLFTLLTFPAPSWADEPIVITVNGNQIEGTSTYIQGFLHGFENVDYDENQIDMALLKALKPKFWRMGVSDKAGHNHLLAHMVDSSVKVALVVSDQLAVVAGSYQNLRPWENWDSYQAYVRELVGLYKQHNLTVDYWDVWSEPDTAGMWTGSCDQAMEMFKRTYQAIRSVDPNAKIVGPSVSDIGTHGACSEPFFEHFLKYITENQLKFDAIAWHEFNQPQLIPYQTEAIRDYFQQHPALGMPEMHVNEYSGPIDAPIPGWAVGWLYYLEVAKINWATRACWERGCQAGLNWLFQDDNVTPTPLYWVHRAYAELPAQRLIAHTENDNTVAIVGKDDDRKQLSLLVGRFIGKRKPFAAASDVKIVIENFPYGKRVYSSVKLIPKNNESLGELQYPTVVSTTRVTTDNQGTITLLLPQMEDGDAYTITLSVHKSTDIAGDGR